MAKDSGSRSSSGLGHLPFTEAAGVRLPYGVPLYFKDPSSFSG